MNYRHAFHAGSFADVMKHSILLTLIEALQRKESGFLYLDTHAGIGRYDLSLSPAQKTHEYESGISKVIQQVEIPAELNEYLRILKLVNSVAQVSPIKELRFYPGSPYWVSQMLRSQDRMILTELHADDYQLLKKEFAHDKQVRVYYEDGYHALKAYLPPIERRGLVLIDPPFENLDEFEAVMVGLRDALMRWANGIYMIWYPIKNPQLIKKFHQRLITANIPKILVAELCIFPDDSPLSLNGSGVVIINPPWQVDLILKTIIPWLWQVLSPEKQGRCEVKWLVS